LYLPSEPADAADDVNLPGAAFEGAVETVIRDRPHGGQIAVRGMLKPLGHKSHLVVEDKDPAEKILLLNNINFMEDYPRTDVQFGEAAPQRQEAGQWLVWAVRDMSARPGGQLYYGRYLRRADVDDDRGKGRLAGILKSLSIAHQFAENQFDTEPT